MKDSDNCLNAVEIIGKILILTPIIVSFPLIIYAILSGVNVSIGDAKGGYSAGLMIVAGIIALIIHLSSDTKRGKDLLKTSAVPEGRKEIQMEENNILGKNMDILKLMSNNLFLRPLEWKKIILVGTLISTLLVVIILIIAMMGGFKGSFASIFVPIYSIIFMPLIVYGLILNSFPELHNFYSYEYDPFIGAIIFVLYWIGIFALVQKSVYIYISSLKNKP